MPVLLIFNLNFNHKTEGFFRSPGAWTLTIALSSKRLCDPHDVTSRLDNDLSQTSTATCKKDRPQMSRDKRFPTMWYVRPATTQISLPEHAVWSEPLLVALIFYACYATVWTSFGVSKLKGGCTGSLSLHLLRSAVAGRIYKLCAKNTSNSGFDRTFMPCSG